MTLKEFIKKNKIKTETFIAVHNKDDRWIVCDTAESPRLTDYLDMTVLDSNVVGMVKVVKLDYAESLSLARLKEIAEQKEALAVTVKRADTKAKTTRKRKAK